MRSGWGSFCDLHRNNGSWRQQRKVRSSPSASLHMPACSRKLATTSSIKVCGARAEHGNYCFTLQSRQASSVCHQPIQDVYSIHILVL